MTVWITWPSIMWPCGSCNSVFYDCFTTKTPPVQL